jgi:hypothetical protein
MIVSYEDVKKAYRFRQHTYGFLAMLARPNQLVGFNGRSALN